MLQVRTDAVRQILRQRALAVSTTPLRIDLLPETQAFILQPDGTVFFGNATVTVTTGIRLDAGDILFISLAPNEAVEMFVVASTSTTVRVLEMA